MELEQTKKLLEFTKCRDEFEEFLLEHDYITQQILRHYRSSSKAIPHIKDYLLMLMYELLKTDKTTALQNIFKNENFKFLKKSDDNLLDSESNEFSSATKSATFISDAITSSIRCKTCNARMHKNSITIDHIERKEDGGKRKF